MFAFIHRLVRELTGSVEINVAFKASVAAADRESGGILPVARLRLTTSGRPEITADGRPLQVARQQLALFVYLMLEGPSGQFERSRLNTLLWRTPNEEALSSALNRLRQIVGSDVLPPAVKNAPVVLRRDFVSCDVLQFEEAIDARDYRRAEELYPERFLEDWRVTDSTRFVEWAAEKRYRLTESHRSCLQDLAQRYASDSRQLDAIGCWRRLANTDLFSAPLVTSAMSGLDKLGAREAAIELGEQHRRLLAPSTNPSDPDAVVQLLETWRSEAVSGPKPPDSSFAGTPKELTSASESPPTRFATRDGRRTGRLVSQILRVAVVVAVPVGAVAAVREMLRRSPPDVDMSAVVVFPLAVTGGTPGDAQLGQSVALALSWGINTTTQLRAIDGWQLLDHPLRDAAAVISEPVGRSMARAHAAGHFVTGTVIIGDSIQLSIDLHNMETDRNVVRHVATVDRAGDPWELGLQAAGEIVLALFGTRDPLDYAALRGRHPTALQAFLRGEHAYRRAQFKEALMNYEAALGTDTSFALAALRAAQTARWTHQERIGERTVAALERSASLPPRYRALAAGLLAYQRYEADSAVAAFQRAIRIDPNWQEAWMALGEAYLHLLPRGPPPDSMANVAFRRVAELDPSFTPALYHRIQMALRDGHHESARRLLDDLRAARADTFFLRASDLLMICVTDSRTAIDWPAEVMRDVGAVSEAAGWFTAGGLPHPECARAAWSAILDHDPTGAYRFGALFALQSILLAQQRYDEFAALLDADTVFDPALLGDLYILAAVGGSPMTDRALPWVDTLRALATRDTTLNPVRLWILGVWEAFTGLPDAAEQVRTRLIRRGTLSAPPEDGRLRRLLAKSLEVRIALARQDTTGALVSLDALAPTGPTQALRWSPWESLGTERVMHAELLLATGAATEALRVGRHLDAPAPISYVAHLSASLLVRERAVRLLGFDNLANQLRQRGVMLSQ